VAYKLYAMQMLHVDLHGLELQVRTRHAHRLIFRFLFFLRKATRIEICSLGLGKVSEIR